MPAGVWAAGGVEAKFVDLQASCKCLAGHACMSVRDSVFPRNSAAIHLMAAVSMQMDTKFKEEQITTLFCPGRGTRRGEGGWMG
eukprot:472238-Pelagomonas_calceolata.AAC.11